MFYYDESGEMVARRDTTISKEDMQRTHVIRMLEAAAYPLEPDAVAALHKELGVVSPALGREKARRRVRRALRRLGIEGLQITDVAEALPDGWKLALKIES